MAQVRSLDMSLTLPLRRFTRATALLPDEDKEDEEEDEEGEENEKEGKRGMGSPRSTEKPVLAGCIFLSCSCALLATLLGLFRRFDGRFLFPARHYWRGMKRGLGTRAKDTTETLLF